MKKIVIVGSSISGAVLAYLLAKQGKKVEVYEQRQEKEIAKKACANVVTKSFFEYCKELSVRPKPLVRHRFEKAHFFSQGKKFSFPVEDYEIDRNKFLALMIKKAKQKGARFHFGMKFLDMKQGKSYDLVFENDNKQAKQFKQHASIVIGADGAMSEVARKAGLFNNRKFCLYIQTRLKDKVKVGGSVLKNDEYCIFSEKDKGYYSYVLPSSKSTLLGVGDFLENNPVKTFEDVSSFAGKSSKATREAALVPLPSDIRTMKDNVFLAGDAACSNKFNGGGIIPAIKDAFAIADVIIKKDYSKMKQRAQEKRMNAYFVKIFRRMSSKTLIKFLGIIHNSDKFKQVVRERDEVSFF